MHVLMASVGQSLRFAALAAPDGAARAAAGGWTFVATRPDAVLPEWALAAARRLGARPDPVRDARATAGWMLTAKRDDDRVPSPANLRYARRVAADCGAPAGSEVVLPPLLGRWYWKWTTEDQGS